MKIFKSLIFLAAIVSVIFSCQKELSYNNNGVSTGTFVKDIYGNCSPATITGVFTKDSVLTNANFVDVQVNATIPGTFNIVSDTVNGFSFSKTGSVVVGNNTIRLYPTGKPIAAGVNNFTITYGTSTCVFTVTVVGPGAVAAVFTLGTTASACTGAVVNGTLTKDSLLTAANTITVNVNVTTPGTYSINATTTNGFAYSSTGLFTTTGNQTVTLVGNGKPTTASNTVVTITNVTTTCTVSVTVNAPTGGTGALYTLDGSPNACTSFAVAGTYTMGTATNASNTVTLNVHVSTIGTYTISTNTVNGITFSKTGSFTTTGAQAVVLTATGTPTAAGTFTYSPTSAATCTFTITVGNAAPPPNTDYFPLTQNSWWSWSVVGQTDTAYSVISGTNTYAGNTYTQMKDYYAGFLDDTSHYRKSGNNYFQWDSTSGYSTYFYFDTAVYADINFLRENAAAGVTWTQSFNGYSSGFLCTLTYGYNVTSTTANVTVNGVNYTNVIDITINVSLTIPALGINNPIEVNDYYYAKGVGLIKEVLTPTAFTVSQIPSATTYEYDLKNYKVY